MMRASAILKFLALPCFIYATWFVTSSIMASFQPRPAKQRLGAFKIIKEGAPVATQATRRSPRVHSSFFLKEREVKVQGNDVHVTAAVDLRSKGRESVYLWRLQAIRAEDNEVLIDMPYVDQLFEMHPSGVMEPKFSETIQLPQGKHRIVLTLSSVPKGYDLTELGDPKRAEAASLITVPTVVNIE